ncbi:Nucleic acid-binding, OB-fold [Sesbania bispinosa]|nr:Nucleic acid-binding, OB-fold [Sesbania bispinosa]
MSTSSTLQVMLKELHPTIETWFIRGHLLRVWHVTHCNDKSRVLSVEMVFMDAEGTKIQASITNDLLTTIQIPLIEGCLYEIRDALVVINEGKGRPTPHSYRLVIQRHSVFFKVKHRVFNKLGLSSVNSSELVDIGDSDDHLIEKIGLLTSISTEREYVTGEKEYLETHGPIPSIVVVQFARIVPPNHLFFGNAGIESVDNITKVLFGPDIPEVYDMISWLAMTDCLLDGKINYLHMKIPDEAIRHKFLLHYPRKKIGELTQEGEHAFYVVWATIMAMVDDECWWVSACKHFPCKPEGPSFNHCDGCYCIIPRFNIKIEVFDGDDSALFILGDDEVQGLVGRSCEDILSSLETPRTSTFPDFFSHLIGKNMLFVVDNKKITGPAEGTYFHVNVICDEREIVRMFWKGECFRLDRMVHNKPSIPLYLDSRGGQKLIVILIIAHKQVPTQLTSSLSVPPSLVHVLLLGVCLASTK